MELYPINLKLTGRRCAVVGGGAVAERKVKALLAAGAAVSVFSPEVTPGLEELAAAGKLTWVAQSYQPGSLHNFFLVFCATNRPEINRRAAEEAKAAGALVNIADAPDSSDFFVPARVAHGDLLLTVSTGGGSPALAKRLREEIAARYGPEYGHYLSLVAKLRPEIKKTLGSARKREKFWREIIDQEALELLRCGKFSEAEERIRHAACSTGPES